MPYAKRNDDEQKYHEVRKVKASNANIVAGLFAVGAYLQMQQDEDITCDLVAKKKMFLSIKLKDRVGKSGAYRVITANTFRSGVLQFNTYNPETGNYGKNMSIGKAKDDTVMAIYNVGYDKKKAEFVIIDQGATKAKAKPAVTEDDDEDDVPF